ncbi:E3 SUMO-protein ligase ZBED1-like [Andrena cerasifolii]|uniref:E3 SUMO-protein ligase ZBED1-like n=1 Tax=Andrena cerasifolii TaxID=2819439 RepID=UPI004037C39C
MFHVVCYIFCFYDRITVRDVTRLHVDGRHELGTPDDTLQTEIKTYMDDKIIEAESCILKWWRDNRTRFPKLARAAQNILGVPASQAYSERLFSRAGNIVTEKRTCLLCHRVEQLYFLSANRPKQQCKST